MRKVFTLVFSLSIFVLSAQEQVKEDVIEVSHKVKVNDAEISYKTIAGNLLLKTEDDKPKATMFYVAYIKEGVEDPHSRPISFCFNGGPGSSSVWLHLGALGPRLIDIEGTKFDAPPYDLIDNPHTLLDTTDLVFIDPVSTGYSKPAPGEDAKQFHGVEEDVASVGSFIRLWTTHYARWESPKFLIGESYGTTRAASLADHLHDTYGMYVNGVVLVSTALNFQTFTDPSGGNDLSYVLSLPTFAAAAWYHKKLSPELQALELSALLKQVEEFAQTDYTVALMRGARQTDESRKATIATLSKYTSLTPEYIAKSNLRIESINFAKELLRSQQKTIGRFDSRITGDNLDNVSASRDYDPSYEAILGAFTAGFYQYVTRELNWKTDNEYKILTSVWPWNFGKANAFLNVGPSLREVMIKDPALRVLVLSATYDLATPYFSVDYTFDHLNLPPNLRSHVTMKTYPAGHMMYLEKPILLQFKNDIATFMHQTLEKP